MRLAVILVLFLPILPARAQQPAPMDEAAVCENRGGEVPQATRIAACSVLLRQGGTGERFAKILVNRAWPLADLGRFGEALDDYAQAVELEPKWAIVYNERGTTYLRMGRLEAAIANYDEALALDSRTVYSLYGRGIAEIRSGDQEAGYRDIAAAKTYDPGVSAVFAAIDIYAP